MKKNRISIALVCILVFCPFLIFSQHRHALLIGNYDYVDWTEIGSNMSEMKAAFEKQQFIVDTVKNATKNEMLNAISNFNKKLTRKDTVVIYYTGHGHQVKDLPPDLDEKIDSLDEVLVPINAPKKSINDNPKHYLLDDELNKKLRTIRHSIGAGDKFLVFMDACHSKGMTRADAAKEKIKLFPFGKNFWDENSTAENSIKWVEISACKSDKEIRVNKKTPPLGSALTKLLNNGSKELLKYKDLVDSLKKQIYHRYNFQVLPEIMRTRSCLGGNLITNFSSVPMNSDSDRNEITEAELKLLKDFINRKDYALLFANQNFDDSDSWQKLNTPFNDIDSLERVLKHRYDFKVNTLKDATLAEFGKKLEEFKDTARYKYNPFDQLLIYFATHGDPDGNLVFSDSKAKNDPLKSSFLSYSKLFEKVNELHFKNIMIIVDVCYGGTAKLTNIKEKETNEDYGYKSAPMSFFGDIGYLISSTGINEEAYDGLTHSPFLEEFLSTLMKEKIHKHIDIESALANNDNFKTSHHVFKRNTSNSSNYFLFMTKDTLEVIKNRYKAKLEGFSKVKHAPPKSKQSRRTSSKTSAMSEHTNYLEKEYLKLKPSEFFTDRIKTLAEQFEIHIEVLSDILVSEEKELDRNTKKLGDIEAYLKQIRTRSNFQEEDSIQIRIELERTGFFVEKQKIIIDKIESLKTDIRKCKGIHLDLEMKSLMNLKTKQ